MSEEFVEISKSRLKLLEGVSKLNNDLWNDPKYGMQIKEIVKEKYPNANIPEVDVVRSTKRAEAEMVSRVEATQKETLSRIEKFETAQRERDEKDSTAKAEADFSKDIESAKKKYQLSPEGMEKVFARMKEKNNPDVEAAAAWVTDHEPKQAPTTTSSYAPQSMDLYGSNSGDKEWADLNRDPLAYGDKVLAEMSNDFANGNFSKYREFGGTL